MKRESLRRPVIWGLTGLLANFLAYLPIIPFGVWQKNALNVKSAFTVMIAFCLFMAVTERIPYRQVVRVVLLLGGATTYTWALKSVMIHSTWGDLWPVLVFFAAFCGVAWWLGQDLDQFLNRRAQ